MCKGTKLRNGLGGALKVILESALGESMFID